MKIELSICSNSYLITWLSSVNPFVLICGRGHAWKAEGERTAARLQQRTEQE